MESSLNIKTVCNGMLLVLIALMGTSKCESFSRTTPFAFVVTSIGRETKETQSVPQSPLYMGMAQPEVEIKTKVTTTTIQKQAAQQKQKIKTDDPISKRKEEFQDAPMYKLMLLGDSTYDTEHVMTRMCAIMDDMDEDQAKTVLEQAQMAGKAMCGIYPFERAELFKEQLLRSDPMIFADLEEENA